MTNTQELKALMVKNNYTQCKMASLLDITIYSFNLKLHNKRDFKSKEIQKIINIFNLNSEDLIKIFFN